MADATLIALIDKFLTAPGTLSDLDKTTLSGYLLRLANTSEAVAGSDTLKLMTPARTKEAITGLSVFRPDLTSTLDGDSSSDNLRSVPTVGVPDGKLIQMNVLTRYDGQTAGLDSWVGFGLMLFTLDSSGDGTTGEGWVSPADFDALTNPRQWTRVLMGLGGFATSLNNLTSHGSAACYDENGDLLVHSIHVADTVDANIVSTVNGMNVASGNTQYRDAKVVLAGADLNLPTAESGSYFAATTESDGSVRLSKIIGTAGESSTNAGTNISTDSDPQITHFASVDMPKAMVSATCVVNGTGLTTLAPIDVTWSIRLGVSDLASGTFTIPVLTGFDGTIQILATPNIAVENIYGADEMNLMINIANTPSAGSVDGVYASISLIKIH